MIRERAFRKDRLEVGTSNDSVNLKPKIKFRFGARNEIEFSKKIVETAYHIKTGKNPGAGLENDVRPFGLQKAKMIELGRHTFHTFVIRKPKQRRPYSVRGEGDNVLLSGKKDNKDSDNNKNLY